MLRFFSTPYSETELQALQHLLNDSLANLQKESECNARECRGCPYMNVCNDLLAVTHYIDELRKQSDRKGVK